MEINKETINQAIDKTKKKADALLIKNRIPAFFSYGVVALIYLAFMFTQDMLFDPTCIQRWEWWIPNLICAACILTVTMTRIDEKTMELKAKDKDIVEIDQIFIKRIRESKYSSSALQAYIVEKNRQNKIETYKSIWLTKLERLNRSFLDTPRALAIWEKGTKEQKLKNPYCKRRLKIEEKLDEDYIEKNIDYLEIKYQKYSFAQLMGGIVNNRKGYFMTQGEYKKKVGIKKAAIKIVIPIIFGTISLTDAVFNGWASVTPTIVRFASLIMAIGTATYSAKDFVDNHLKGFYLSRIEFFQQFEEEQAKKGQVQPEQVAQEKKATTEVEINKTGNT